MTVTSCSGKHMTSWLFLTLVLPFQRLILRNVFHAVNIAIQQQQYCNTVWPQLTSDLFTSTRPNKQGDCKDCYTIAIQVNYFDIKGTYFCCKCGCVCRISSRNRLTLTLVFFKCTSIVYNKLHRPTCDWH